MESLREFFGIPEQSEEDLEFGSWATGLIVLATLCGLIVGSG